jgi:hypothetical protein
MDGLPDLRKSAITDVLGMNRKMPLRSHPHRRLSGPGNSVPQAGGSIEVLHLTFGIIDVINHDVVPACLRAKDLPEVAKPRCSILSECCVGRQPAVQPNS